MYLSLALATLDLEQGMTIEIEPAIFPAAGA